MTYQEFLVRVTAYYGGYPDGSRVPGYVLAYLKKDIDEEKLDALFRFLSYSHPVNYGAPDIAAIEKAIAWSIQNGKGSDVHKSKAKEGGMSTEPVELTDEERETCDALIDAMKKKLGGMSMDAREKKRADARGEG